MFKKRQLKSISAHKRPRLRRPFNRSKFLKILAIPLLVILLALFFLMVKTNPFQIKQVRFLSPAVCVPNAEIEAQIAHKSQNFLSSDFSKLETKILAKYPCL